MDQPMVRDSTLTVTDQRLGSAAGARDEIYWLHQHAHVIIKNCGAVPASGSKQVRNVGLHLWPNISILFLTCKMSLSWVICLAKQLISDTWQFLNEQVFDIHLLLFGFYIDLSSCIFTSSKLQK
jgi:hypothetical protein